MRINKALIIAAGYGTRFFPITKTIQKEMLPILNRPIIDYIVEDCIKAGIEEIVFVVKPTDTQIKGYYTESNEIKDYLNRVNKFDKYEAIEKIHTKAKFSFIYQEKDQPYGTATPVKIAKEIFKNEEAFLAVMADDFIFNADGSSEIQRMITLFNSTDALALMTCVSLDKERIQKYAVVKTDEVEGKHYLNSLIEKPDLDSIDTNFANISKYIFTPKVFELLDEQKVNPNYNEFVITDTVLELLKHGKVLVHQAKGSYIDSGDVKNWLNANIEIGKAQGLL